jgi:hypothetical protein
MIRIGLSLWSSKASSAAAILISGLTVAEDAATGTAVGTLTVANATGTPTFTLVDDAGGKFVLDGDDVEVAAALDYETATSHEIEVSVSGTTPAIDNRLFTIDVTDVEEGGDAGSPIGLLLILTKAA